MRITLFGLICLCGLSFVTAQECAPDPGPPIFLEDFGSGSNPGPALSTGTTSYTYGQFNTSEARYVVSNTSGLIDMFWHEGSDHTEGDTDGYMVLFNVTGALGTFYQRTFTDLCPNTDYYFSGFMANLVVPTGCIGNAVKPEVRFTVTDPTEGTTLATTTSGQILFRSFLTWEEYGIHFRTGPDQTTVFIKLTNAAPGGCGNDLAIDDLSLRLCNVQIEQSFDLCELPSGSVTVGNSTYTEPGVYLDALPVPNSCNDTLITTDLTGATRRFPTLSFTLCQGDTLEVAGQRFTASASFVDTLPGSLPDCPQFQPYEIIAQSLEPITQDVTLCNADSLQVGNNWYTSAGTYVDSLSTFAGCDSVVITTINTGEIAVTIDLSAVNVEFGQSIQLMGSVSLSDIYTLSWQPSEALSCTDCLDPILLSSSSGSYQLIATDTPSGCTASASVEVVVAGCEKVFVPNAFSPNADQVNDRLEVFAEPCFTQLISWRIFDRWGGQVYEVVDQPLSNSFVGWDGLTRGQAAIEGVYGYQLIVERMDGTQQEIRGEVVLLR